MGFQVLTSSFVDGHERPDVVEYTKRFLCRTVGLGFLTLVHTREGYCSWSLCVCVCVCVCLSVCLSVNRFSCKPCLLWVPNVEVRTSTMGALYSKKVERRWQQKAFSGCYSATRHKLPNHGSL